MTNCFGKNLALQHPIFCTSFCFWKKSLRKREKRYIDLVAGIKIYLHHLVVLTVPGNWADDNAGQTINTGRSHSATQRHDETRNAGPGEIRHFMCRGCKFRVVRFSTKRDNTSRNSFELGCLVFNANQLNGQKCQDLSSPWLCVKHFFAFLCCPHCLDVVQMDPRLHQRLF